VDVWTLIFPHHAGRTPTHGYEATREAAMAAFAKSWGSADFFSGSFLKFGPVQTPHPPQREGVRGVGAARARASLSSGEIYGCLEFGSSTC
jgi:hypothetical protein